MITLKGPKSEIAKSLDVSQTVAFAFVTDSGGVGCRKLRRSQNSEEFLNQFQ